jgi:hypothetical protein
MLQIKAVIDCFKNEKRFFFFFFLKMKVDRVSNVTTKAKNNAIVLFFSRFSDLSKMTT